jgi:hypothetical protein
MTAGLSEHVRAERAGNGRCNPNGRDGRSTDEYALPGLLLPDSSTVAVGPAATLVRVRMAALVAVSTTM